MSPLRGLVLVLLGILAAVLATAAKRIAAPRIAMAARVVRALLARAGIHATLPDKKVEDGPSQVRIDRGDSSVEDAGSHFVDSMSS
jgi:hypothetical protein